jgi:hypothetical protein
MDKLKDNQFLLVRSVGAPGQFLMELREFHMAELTKDQVFGIFTITEYFEQSKDRERQAAVLSMMIGQLQIKLSDHQARQRIMHGR